MPWPTCSQWISIVDGKYTYCPRTSIFQDVTGAYCALHWDKSAPLNVRWYQNGIAYGWDESRRDPLWDEQPPYHPWDGYDRNY